MLNSLNVALSGLYASKTDVENVMNNIANENSIGYKKRVVDVKESEHSDARLTGRGATVIDVNRITNMYMADNLSKQQSKTAEYTELSTMLADIESIFNETDSSGFSNNLDGYFQAIEDMRANPYNEIYRTNVINQGNMLVDSLQSLYYGIDERAIVAESSLYDHIDEVNGILNDIGNVNQLIQDAINPSNDLLDKRDLLETRLSEYMQIEVDRTNGDYTLEVGGITAVRYDTNIREIVVVNDNIAQKDIYVDDLNNSTLVDSNWGGGDTLTYYFNKDVSLTINAGDTITDDYGTFVVDKNNVVRAITYQINNDPILSNSVTAYNGQYSIDDYGNRILQAPQTSDHYLIIEGKSVGSQNSFVGRIIVNDDNVSDVNGNQISNIVERNNLRSNDAETDIHLEIYGQEVTLESGKIKPILDNLDTTSPENKFNEYKNMLNSFAKALSDVTEAYIFEGENNYISGEEASLLNKDKASIQTIGMFNGVSVNTLMFNSAVVRNLTQADLDYLSTIHWNETLQIGDNENTSFSKYFQNIKITISADKENVDYMQETQKSITQSLQNTYDKLVKVDKDEEMVNLIKFQAAYEANAKLITIVDEMLQTILGMKR